MPLDHASSSSSNDIYYWDGYIELEKTTRGVLAKNRRNPTNYEKTIQKIINREWAALEPHKVSNTIPPILSVSINREDRLLVTTTVRNGKRCLLILEVVLDHDYGSAHFLQPDVLVDFLGNNENTIWEKISAEDADNLLQLPAAKEEASFKPVEYYNQNFIQLSDEQQSVHNKTLPLVISGVAGSGKSVLAFSMLANKRRENAALGNMSPLLYLTKSSELAREMRRKWAAYDSQDPNLPPVLIMTYEEWAKNAPELSNKTILTDKIYFNNWHKSLLEQHINKEKADKKAGNVTPSEAIFNDSNKLYQEFRIIGGLKKEEYLALGKRQSLFPAHTREAIWDAFDSFKKSLPKNSVYLDFTKISVDQDYALIVVDESQDLSSEELSNLINMAGQKIVFFIDTHQGLHDTLSKREKLKSLFNKHGITPDKLLLTKAYRSPKSHVHLINALFNITYHLTGGIADKDEQSFIIPDDDLPEGHLNWQNNLSKEFIEHVNAQANSTQFVVICTKSHQAEARKHFPKAVILTPEESKGLEFKTVLLFRPLDEEIYREANAKLPKDTDFSMPPESAVNRAREDVGDAKYAPFFNHLVTACSRSTNGLIIYQPKDRKVQKISDSLQNAKKKTVITQEAEQQEKPVSSTPEEWFALARKFYFNKNKAQAVFILETHLKKNKQEINGIIQHWDNPQAMSASLNSTSVKPEITVQDDRNELKETNEIIQQKDNPRAREASSISTGIKPEITSPINQDEKKERPKTVKSKKKGKKKKKTPALTLPPKPESSVPAKSEKTSIPQPSSNTLWPSSGIMDMRDLLKEETRIKLEKTIDQFAPLQRVPAKLRAYNPFEKIEKKREIYISLLEKRSNPEDIWNKIFADTQFEDLANTKEGEYELNLFEQVIESEKLTQGLNNYLNVNPKNISLIPDDFFITHASSMAENANSDANKLLCKKICNNPDLLFKSKINYPSVLYQLAEHSEGRKTLIDLLDIIQKLGWKHNRTANELFILQPNTTPQKSVFEKLCEDHTGLQLVRDEFLQLPGWTEMTEWLQHLLFDSPDSLVTNMAMHDAGIETLDLLFQKLPNLTISIEKLREIVPDTIKKRTRIIAKDKVKFISVPKQSSLLRSIADGSTGLAFLSLIWEKITPQLNADDLFKIQDGKSVFYCLLKSCIIERSNENVLSRIFTLRPDLVNGITRENLMERYNMNDPLTDHHFPMTALYVMLSEPKLTKHLHSLVENNPGVFDDFSLNDLISISGKDPEGKMLFEQIFYKDLILAKALLHSKNASILLTVNPETKEPYLFKLLRAGSLEEIKLLLESPCTELALKNSKESFTEVLAFHPDSKRIFPLLKQRIRAIEKTSFKATDKSRDTFFNKGKDSSNQRKDSSEPTPTLRNKSTPSGKLS